jgi:hypothetical protein
MKRTRRRWGRDAREGIRPYEGRLYPSIPLTAGAAGPGGAAAAGTLPVTAPALFLAAGAALVLALGLLLWALVR